MLDNPEAQPLDQRRLSISRVEMGLIAILFIAWMPGIAQLVAVWSSVEYASHGFLVPLVAIWAATAHRAELALLEVRPLSGGFVLMGGVAVGYVVVLLIHDPTLLGLMAVMTVVASVLALRGWAWASTLRFSLGYLLFMVPLPSAWVTPLIVKLQLLVSSLGVEILQSAGVAIYRQGNVLTLPGDLSLFVAEACSGITSLITLVPIGVFIAYFTESVLWRRLLLVAAVVPIALAMNLVRVILTVLVSIHVSVEVATGGPLHEWAGVVTYIVGCGFLLGVGALMRRLLPEGGLDPLR